MSRGMGVLWFVCSHWGQGLADVAAEEKKTDIAPCPFPGTTESRVRRQGAPSCHHVTPHILALKTETATARSQCVELRASSTLLGCKLWYSSRFAICCVSRKGVRQARGEAVSFSLSPRMMARGQS